MPTGWSPLGLAELTMLFIDSSRVRMRPWFQGAGQNRPWAAASVSHNQDCITVHMLLHRGDPCHCLHWSPYCKQASHEALIRGLYSEHSALLHFLQESVKTITPFHPWKAGHSDSLPWTLQKINSVLFHCHMVPDRPGPASSTLPTPEHCNGSNSFCSASRWLGTKIQGPQVSSALDGHSIIWEE